MTLLFFCFELFAFGKPLIFEPFRRGNWSQPFLKESGCETVVGGKTLENKGFRDSTPFGAKTPSAEGRKFCRTENCKHGGKTRGIPATLFTPCVCYFFAGFGGQIWGTAKTQHEGRPGAVRADANFQNKHGGKTLENKGFQEPPSSKVAKRGQQKKQPKKKRKNVQKSPPQNRPRIAALSG